MDQTHSQVTRPAHHCPFTRALWKFGAFSCSSRTALTPNHPPTCSLTHPFVHQVKFELTYMFNDPPLPSLTHTLTHPLIYLLTHPLSHWLTHSITGCPSKQGDWLTDLFLHSFPYKQTFFTNCVCVYSRLKVLRLKRNIFEYWAHDYWIIHSFI